MTLKRSLIKRARKTKWKILRQPHPQPLLCEAIRNHLAAEPLNHEPGKVDRWLFK